MFHTSDQGSDQPRSQRPTFLTYTPLGSVGWVRPSGRALPFRCGGDRDGLVGAAGTGRGCGAGGRAAFLSGAVPHSWGHAGACECAPACPGLVFSLSLDSCGWRSRRMAHTWAVHSMTNRRAWSTGLGFSDSLHIPWRMRSTTIMEPGVACASDWSAGQARSVTTPLNSS